MCGELSTPMTWCPRLVRNSANRPVPHAASSATARLPAGKVLSYDRLVGREQPAASIRVVAGRYLLVDGGGADLLNQHAAVPQPLVAPTYRHQLGDYLRAALGHGLQVKRCEEPRVVRADEPLPEPATEIGDWQDWPFSLTDYLPSAGRASGGRPHVVIWHFQLPASCRLPGRPDPA